MLYNDKSINTPSEIADAFADFFKSVYQCPSNSDAYPVEQDCITIMSISENEVIAAGKALPVSNAIGCDEVPSFIVKDCIYLWAKPICQILNESLKQDIFPERWKSALIVPIHKAGKVNEINNYRPIAILSPFAKIYEKILYRRIFHMVKNRISTSQHGFYSGRSTVTNLIDLTQTVAEGLDNNLQTEVIYTDFRKAFDTVNHNILLAKLAEIGLSKKLLNLFKSYLSGRKQYVFYKGTQSSIFIPTSGVPQGSCLSTLLFAIFINDLTKILGSGVLLFADDVKLIRHIQSATDILLLQNQLNKFSEWL